MTRSAPVALAAFLSSGCSFAFAHRAPAVLRVPDEPVACTPDGPLLPLLDAACGALFGALAAREFGSDDCEGVPSAASCNRHRAGVGIGHAAIAGACLASGIWGVASGLACSELRSWNQRCVGGDRAACEHLTPGWKPPPFPPQRPDGRRVGEGCLAAWQCATGLACVEGRCAPPWSLR